MNPPVASTPHIMRGALEHIQARFDMEQPRAVLFTTFNFVSQFFEANVLPLLVGDAVEELEGAKEVRRQINEELGTTRCLVVCDRSTCPEPKGDMRYGLLPVGLPNGRFHPKIILMAGTLKDSRQSGIWLSVGSGNLSLSGWAINREVVGVTAVARQHADQLLPLLVWLKAQATRQLQVPEGTAVEEEGKVRSVLDALIEALNDSKQLAPAHAGMPTLHLALPIPGSTHPALISALKGNQAWQAATVVSPYWSGVDALADTLSVQECNFVPSLSRDGQYSFPIDSLDTAPSYRRGFRKFAAAADRFTHAKALLFANQQGQTVLCIGSANFTRAAMLAPHGGALANVEAMLRYDLKDAPDPWQRRFAPLHETELVQSPSGQEEEQAPPLPPFDANMLCDWKTRSFSGQITVTGDQQISNAVLQVAGMNYRLTASPGVPHILNGIPFRGVQPIRSFSITYTVNGDGLTYRGLVLQVNAEDDDLGYLPPPRLQNILELLRGLDPTHTGQEPNSRSRRIDGDGDGEEPSTDPSFDFFRFFQATCKLAQYHDQSLPPAVRRDPYKKNSPYSLTTLHRAVVLQPGISDEQKIGRYIQLSELRELVRRIEQTGPSPSSAQFLPDLENELVELETDVTTMLKRSSAFKAMFGETSSELATTFLAWFRDEIALDKANTRREP